MKISYSKLTSAASKAKASLMSEGGPSGVRTRPRDEEKTESLYLVNVQRMKKYKPFRKPDGMLVLPYFKQKQ